MLRILVLSDIHDNLDNLLRVVKNINLQDFSYILFCGDLVSPFTASLISKHIGSNSIFLGVWGNNDGDRDTIITRISKGEIGGSLIISKLDGKDILIMHGAGSIELTEKLIKSLLKSLDYDIIFYGHTHLAKVLSCDRTTREIKVIDVKADLSNNREKTYEFDLGKVAIAINPGELCGYLTGIPSIASIDLNENKVRVRFIRVDLL